MCPAPPRATIRQTVDFLRDPAVFTGGAGLELGDLYRIGFPATRIFVATHPAHFEQVLTTAADAFVKGRVYWGEFRRSLGDAMGALDGARWTRLNRVQQPFFTPRAVSGRLPVAASVIRDTVAAMGGQDPLPVVDALAAMNARMILATFFEREDEPRAHDIARRIGEGNLILDWRSRYPWRRFTSHLNGVARTARDLTAFFENYVHELTEAAEDPDALLAALSAFLEASGDGDYSPSLVRNEVMFHLGASTETLAAAQGWALYLLWKHPEILDAVRSEVDEALAGAPATASPGPGHLDALALTARVVQETVRLYPPVYAVVRDCASATRLGDVDLRPGDTVVLSILGLHRNPRLWTDPSAFDPDRFTVEGRSGIGRHQYLPFGAGRHVCTGRHLALPAMVLTVAQFARRFDWSFEDDDVAAESRPSLKPVRPFRATFAVRP